MRILLAIAVLSIPVGPGFGDAEATATGLDDGRVSVDLSVEVEGSGSVVAHLIEPGGEQQTVALRDRDGSEHGAVFETRPIDLVVVFEVLADPPRQSEPVRLTELGVARETLGMAPVGDLAEVVEEAPSESSQWGWLGLALGAGALALLAIWALDEGRDDETQGRHEAASDRSG